MYSNISCAAPSCTNPIIGQCAGYKGSCGRYYCATHSTDRLCADCARHKHEDEVAEQVYQDYLSIAEQIQREVILFSSFSRAVHFARIFGIGAVVAALGGLLFSVSTHYYGQPVAAERYAADALAGFLLYALAMFFVVTIWMNSWCAGEAQKKALEINQTKPGFLEFYDAWRAKKKKDAMMGMLRVAGVIAVIGLGAAASAAASTSEDARTRRAVDDELRRHGL